MESKNQVQNPAWTVGVHFALIPPLSYEQKVGHFDPFSSVRQSFSNVRSNKNALAIGTAVAFAVTILCSTKSTGINIHTSITTKYYYY